MPANQRVQCARCTRTFAPNDCKSKEEHERTHRPRSSDDEDEDKDDHDPPKGIQVDIETTSGRAPQGITNGIRSVFFDDGTQYKIVITNDTNNRKRVAVEVTVDGSPVRLTPLLVGAGRKILGFTEERSTTEDVQKGELRYQISEKVRPFVAKKPSLTASTAAADRNIGKIEFKFFAVKIVNAKEGSRNRSHVRQPETTGLQGVALPGVLRTSKGPTQNTNGVHSDGGRRKPVCDHSYPLGSCVIKICDRQSRTLDELFNLIQLDPALQN